MREGLNATSINFSAAALAAAVVLGLLLQFLSLARECRDRKVQKLGPRSSKSVNPEGVGDSAVQDTAVESLEVYFTIFIKRAICCRKSGNCRASPAATQHDWTWVRVLGPVPVHSQSFRDHAGAFWHSTTKGKKARLSESGPSGLRVCLLVAPGAPEAEACLHSRSMCDSGCQAGSVLPAPL